jgi:2-phospho-L-lactate guanylyltransferase
MSDATKIWAVMPVKRFAAAKSRLAPALGTIERATLARLMFEDVLDSLTQCNGVLAGTLVITSDDEAAAIARSRGAKVIDDDGEFGINAAIGRTVRTVTGQDGIIIIPSDIPQVLPNTIMMSAGAISASRTLVIAAAAEDGGTNLLACRPATATPLCFGVRSFDRHRRAGLQAGFAVQQLSIGDLSIDIDRPEDLGAFLKINSKTRTHAYLSSLGMRSRLDGHSLVSSGRT